MLTFRGLGRWGRFANGCFQIASTIGLARKNNHQFCFPQWINHDHKDRFGSTEDINIYQHLVNPLPEFVDLPYQDVFIQWGYHEVTFKDGAFSINAHMQSEQYFKHCIDEVRHYMRMKDEPEQNDFVVLHYRRGDYELGENAYHPVCTPDYYKKAVEHFPGRRFLVFSDDELEAEILMRVIDNDRKLNFTIVKGMDYLESYKLMKRCKDFIVSNSSYSMFAAIMGEHPEKKIVAPAKWFGGEGANLNRPDIYPEGTIII